MAIKTQKVYSSHVNEMSYDEETGDLVVTFSRGNRALYSGVPPKTAREVMNAPSVGQAMHDQIIGNYPHRYV